jgi:hypothetical protein
MSKRDWEGSNQETLSLEEIEGRAWDAAGKLVALDDDVSAEEAEELRAYFASECIALLAQNYSIGVPSEVTWE